MARDEANVHDTIEEVMDRFGIGAVLRCVVNICREKVAYHWNDQAIEGQWRKMGNWVERKLVLFEKRFGRG